MTLMLGPVGLVSYLVVRQTLASRPVATRRAVA